MDISVIIPTYRPHEYLWECLESLYNQSFPKDRFEVIVILNGEKDPYEGQIKDYICCHKEQKIVYCFSNDTGVSAARNKGIDVARGAYVSFLDDDDYVSPSYLEELYQISSMNTIGLAYPYAFNDGYPQIQLNYGITEEYNRCAHNRKQNYKSPKKYFSGPCMKLIHRDIIGNRRFDASFTNGEDSLFMFLISNLFKNVDFTSRKAVYYRRYRSNSAVTSHKKNVFWLKNSFRMFVVYTKIYIKDFPNYSFYFYMTRVLGCVHMSVVKLISY